MHKGFITLQLIVFSDCDSNDELSTETAVVITFIATFLITFVVTALITYIITNMCNKHQHKLNQDEVDVKNVNTEKKDPHHNPSYENVILKVKDSNPEYALPTSTIKMDTNPAYGNTSTIKMDANPAYASTNM